MNVQGRIGIGQALAAQMDERDEGKGSGLGVKKARGKVLTLPLTCCDIGHNIEPKS